MTSTAGLVALMLRAALIMILVVSPAFGQTGAPNPSPDPSTTRWTVVAGVDRFSFRDIARSRRPVDASPVAWEGDGPALGVRYALERTRRLHEIAGSVSFAGGFSYRTPLRSSPAGSADRMGRLEGRYDYLRYPLDDLGFDGLDLGLGVRATGARLWFRRESPDAGTYRDAETQLGTAFVAAARLRRFRRIALEAAWANGLQISRWQARSDGNLSSAARAWGGGWITELTLTARARLSSRASVAVSYVGVGEGLFASHRAYTTTRRHVLAGVTYDR